MKISGRKSVILIAVKLLVFFSPYLFIQCTDEVEPKPQHVSDFSFSEIDTIDFGYFSKSHPLAFTNTSEKMTEWEIRSESNLIAFSENTGELNPGDSMEIVVTFQRENLNDHVFHAEITLENQQSSSKCSLPVTAKNYNAINFLKKGIVKDARYDRVNDVLVYVTENPNELRTIYTSNNTSEVISLVLPPQALSVRPDGKYAVVAHNGWVSYINLELMQVEKVYPVPADINDIVIAPNNWAYIFPKPRHNIFSLNLATGAVIEMAGISGIGSARANLHPSGSYFYRIASSISPSKLEKFDTQSGSAAFLYGNINFSNNNYGSYFWISDNGNLIFSNYRNIFSSATQQEDDMLMVNQLEGNTMMIAFDYHTDVNRIYSVHRTRNSFDLIPDKFIRKYKASDFSYMGSVEIPDYLVDTGGGDGEFYEAEGHWGFFNAVGDKYFLLIKAHSSSEVNDQWGWVSFIVD